MVTTALPLVNQPVVSPVQGPTTPTPVSAVSGADPRVSALVRAATSPTTAGGTSNPYGYTGAQAIASNTVDQVRQSAQRISDIYAQGQARRNAAAQAAAQAEADRIARAQPAQTPVSVAGGSYAGVADNGAPLPTGGRYTTAYKGPTGDDPTKLNLTRVDNGWLRPDVAVALARLKTAFQQATGRSLSLTEGWRAMSRTAALHAQNPSVNAAPGSSKHNYGTAMDLSGMGDPNSPSFRWLVANAPKYDFSWDTGRRIGEPWHWEYTV